MRDSLPDKPSTKEIIVTGAHRSGTSAISNFLVNLGVDVGNPEMLLEQAQDNQKGFFERLDVMRINDTILQCANSSWHKLDLTALAHPGQITVTRAIRTEIQNVLKSFPDDNLPFLLKDPRFSLTLPVWLEYFSRPTIIVCLRNPLEIARSLQKRNGFSIYKSLAIWETYLRSLYLHSEDQKCIVVNFNQLLSNPEKYGKRFFAQLNASGINDSQPIEKAIHSSFDISLKHEECTDQELESLLSVRQMELWRKLKIDHDVDDRSEKYRSYINTEALRQKDTDTGYSRLEIQLETKFTDISESPKIDSQLIARHETFFFEINRYNVQSFTLAPINRPCVIKFISLEAISREGAVTRVKPTSMNGLFDPTLKWYYFPQENPSICYQTPFAHVATIKVSILFASLDRDTVKQLLIDFLFSRDKRHTKQLSRTTHAQRKKNLNSVISKNSPSGAKSLPKQLKSVYHLAKLATKPKELWSFIKHYKELAKNPSLFSPDFYCNSYKDVDPSAISPLNHFLLFGHKEGRSPSREFNSRYYLDTYPDVEEEGLNPLLHYIGKGWKEGRNPSPTFSSNNYIADNPGILFSDTNPLSHKQTATEELINNEEEIMRFVEKRSRHVFKKAVAVIIPVYLANEVAVGALELLLHSLCSSYPEPNKKLTFTVIDDASPIKVCKKLLLEKNFFDRSDVNFLENVDNLGFTRTINRGIEQAPKRADVVILNSDTEIHGPIFEILQRACYREPHTGSVTPLSNRATIASLINWPFGTKNIYSLTPEETSEIIEKTGLVGPSSGAPTGHGFCMYMSRKAIKDAGHFDAETFGQGYGEENDWSMRAIKAGYTHRICTECFVHHHESKSFEPNQKSRLQKENSEKLHRTYPYYTNMVQKYLREDPSKIYRKLLKLFLLETQKKKSRMQTICIVIHDSFTNHAGGVQQHVKHLLNTLNAQNKFELIIISPTTFKGQLYELHLFHQPEAIVLSNLGESFLTQLLPRLKNRVDFLHVHHVHGLQQYLVDWIINLKVQNKVLTIHDYDLFCSNPFLLNENNEFCLEKEPKEGCADKSCLNSKEISRKILNSFDLLLTPSTNCKNYITQITNNKSIERKLHTLPHFLPFADEIEAIPSQDNSSALSKNIIFLGSLFPHKGGDIFLNSVEAIEKTGFITQVWGHAQNSLLSKYTHIPPIVPYKNWRELQELYRIYGAHIVVIPAVCAETFSYTLFEALFLFEVPVITGPFGNPSELVHQHGVGEVLANTASTELVLAIDKITTNYESYQRAVKSYKKKYFSEFSKYNYIEKYSKLLIGSEKSVNPNVQLTTHLEPAPLSEKSKAIMNKALQLKANEKLHVLFIHALSEQDPPFFFRVENPIKYLEKSGSTIEIYHVDDAPLNVDQYDLIYLSRTPLTDNLSVLLRNAKANKIPSVLDVDDLIFHTKFLTHFYFLKDSSADFKRYKKLLTGLEKTFMRVDFLLGSTPGIAAMGEQFGKKSAYFRNRLRFSYLENYKKLYRTRPQFKKQLIGYFAGSNTHDKDLNMMTPVLREIFELYPQAKLLLMGFVGNDSFIKQHPDRIIVQEFDNYAKYLEIVRNCKVIIAPIAEINEFSQAKSSIKFLEAASVGTPIISSPIDEMIYCIEEGVTGWLAANDHEWLEKITTALNGDYAEQVGDHANEYVMKKFTDGSSDFNQLFSVIAC
ncbi:MAG: glycosyltransferase [Bacteroidetes bacterium]|nr:glycosyltransferase [Bacteroidota bacterium]